MIPTAMRTKIADHPHMFKTRDGRTFQVTVMGEERKDGTWSGWLEFRDAQTGQTLKTEQETSQPNRAAVEYWASGIEDVYLEGALKRARSARN